MYGGVVIEVIDEYGPTTGAPYGNFVKILSYTDLDTGSGFEHQYAHLSTVAAKCGDVVTKGFEIGGSGNTGGKVAFSWALTCTCTSSPSMRKERCLIPVRTALHKV